MYSHTVLSHPPNIPMARAYSIVQIQLTVEQKGLQLPTSHPSRNKREEAVAHARAGVALCSSAGTVHAAGPRGARCAVHMCGEITARTCTCGNVSFYKGFRGSKVGLGISIDLVIVRGMAMR